MNRNLLKITAIIVIFSFIVTGCGKVTNISESKNPSKPKEDYVQALNSAKQIEIKESFISIGKQYKLYVDGVEVGEVTGRLITAFGDVFTLKDRNGHVLASEKQIKRWHLRFDRDAAVYDGNGNLTGYIGEEALTKIFSIGYFFHFFDKNGNEIGTSDQVNFSLLKENIFRNADGIMAYKVNKELTLIRDSYQVNIYDKSKIQLYQAIFMVCIEDAIKDASKKKKK